MSELLKLSYYVSNKDLDLINKIEKELDSTNLSSNQRNQSFLKKSKVRSIHSSLAIENNSLSIDDVTNIFNHELVNGTKREIQEVKNAIELYDHINEYNWKLEQDFIQAHTLLMKYFNDDQGYYRKSGEGIKRGNTIIYIAPQSDLVPILMNDLFEQINILINNEHPLVIASLFHYYAVFIHPFSDGNGRISRFWMSLILKHYNPVFEYIPIEEEIYLNQEEYYDSISKCHTNGNANVFIHFILKTILRCIRKTTQKTTQKTNPPVKLNDNQKRILDIIYSTPTITRNQLADEIGISPDGVKYNLNKLKEKQIIKHVGSDRSGYWEIIDDTLI